MNYLQELSGEPLVGVLLQELAVAAAEPKVVQDTGSVVRFESILQDTKPNRNKRIYNESVLAEAVMAGPVQERLRTRTMYGEANHPFTTDLSRQMVVDMTRVSHLVTGLEAPRSGLVRGVIETAATRAGRDMRGLIVENKSTVAFSMRGMGGVKRVPGKDLVEVTSPLALVTYDWVTFPSHQAAYMDRAGLNEHAFVAARSAVQYAKDQSRNVRALTEQLELENAEFALTDDQQSLIISSGQTIVKAFLEADVRADFRAALLGLGR
jgi:hypothetical protein